MHQLGDSFSFTVPGTDLCTDIDECGEGISGCSQLCNNTVGSFECSCEDGYQLAFDEKTCNGLYAFTVWVFVGMCVCVSLSTSNMCALHATDKPLQVLVYSVPLVLIELECVCLKQSMCGHYCVLKVFFFPLSYRC